MKKIVSSLVLLILSFAVSAEQTVSQQLKEKLSEIAGFSAQFKQKVLDSKKQVVQLSEGNIELIQPNKFRWETLPPNDSLLMSDGVSVWFYDPFVEQATVYNFADTVNSNPILLLLQPDASAWQEYIIEKPSASVFKVTSKSQRNQIEYIEISFTQDNAVEWLTIKDRQQQTSHYQFFQFKQTQLSDFGKEYFVFKLPEGADLDDQRQQ
ncbi:outer membrane lipoprotein chaperone LolA [Catenovulum sediminis]|uniref:Outer-membrane lipoprotein carrier protein n=1 Tax=Catenovulum sediminis TaxID=1740262 RepID=A0ABV1RH48_9ALTE|nr:outer membrane lipoprotein chaperone LolA [Catenovulum sediminis]